MVLVQLYNIKETLVNEREMNLKFYDDIKTFRNTLNNENESYNSYDSFENNIKY